MSNPVQYLSALKALAKDIQEQGPRIAKTMALTGSSIVQERIQKSGIPGKKYSTNFIPAYYLRGKELNAGGKAYLEDHNLNDDLTNWGEFRKAQGLQAEFVDLTYSGRMFAGLVLQAQSANGSRFTATMGGSDMEVDKKLGWNSERYGDFLEPNTEEKAEIDEIVNDEFEKLIKKHFGR
jgi:hypothetical protein